MVKDELIGIVEANGRVLTWLQLVEASLDSYLENPASMNLEELLDALLLPEPEISRSLNAYLLPSSISEIALGECPL